MRSPVSAEPRTDRGSSILILRHRRSGLIAAYRASPLDPLSPPLEDALRGV